MLLDPFLYDVVAEHQRVLREAAERAHHVGVRGPGWWRLPLGVPEVVESRTVVSVVSRRLVCGRPLACRNASGHASVGYDA